MAITINDYPEVITPAYNENIYLVTSTNTAQPNFKYVFDIYNSAGTTLLARVKLPARPTDARCAFDVKRVIENLVSYNLPDFYEEAGFYHNSNSYYKYTIKFGEEYGTTPTVHADLATKSNQYIYNGALSHNEFRYYSLTGTIVKRFVIPYSLNQYQTNAPLIQNIEAGQRAYLYAMVNEADCIANAIIQKYNSAGTLLDTLTIANPYSALSADADRFLRFSCGHYQIDSYESGWLDDASYYTVYFEDVEANPVTTPCRYNLTENCRYETVRLHFLNTKGGFDSFSFTLKSTSKQDVTRNTYNKGYGSQSGTTWGYELSDRGNTTFYTEEAESYTATSDWLTEDESNWLKELIASPEVYQETINDFIAVDIINNSYEPQKKVNNKLFNLTIQFKPSVNNTKQRA